MKLNSLFSNAGTVIACIQNCKSLVLSTTSNKIWTRLWKSVIILCIVLWSYRLFYFIHWSFTSKKIMIILICIIVCIALYLLYPADSRTYNNKSTRQTCSNHIHIYRLRHVRSLFFQLTGHNGRQWCNNQTITILMYNT